MEACHFKAEIVPVEIPGKKGVTVIEKFPKEKVTEDFQRLADRLLDRESAIPAKGGERGLVGLFNRVQAEVVRA